jgi:hypothetical protein
VEILVGGTGPPQVSHCWGQVQQWGFVQLNYAIKKQNAKQGIKKKSLHVIQKGFIS